LEPSYTSSDSTEMDSDSQETARTVSIHDEALWNRWIRQRGVPSLRDMKNTDEGVSTCRSMDNGSGMYAYQRPDSEEQSSEEGHRVLHLLIT
jgi:hypothetical protein